MTFFLVASGASLTIGIGLGCLIVAPRDAFKHEAQAACVPLSLNAPRPGGRGAAPRAPLVPEIACASL